ncbi:MAG: hypothetical protein AAGJ86_11540 [Pseudomonadota bacterium]
MDKKSLAQLLFLSILLLLQACRPIPETRYLAEAEIPTREHGNQVEAVIRKLALESGLRFWSKPREEMDIIKSLMPIREPFIHVLFLEDDPLLTVTNVPPGDTLSVALAGNYKWREEQLQQLETQVVEALTAIGFELDEINRSLSENGG